MTGSGFPRTGSDQVRAPWAHMPRGPFPGDRNREERMPTTTARPRQGHCGWGEGRGPGKSTGRAPQGQKESGGHYFTFPLWGGSGERSPLGDGGGPRLGSSPATEGVRWQERGEQADSDLLETDCERMDTSREVPQITTGTKWGLGRKKQRRPGTGRPPSAG